ncbi:cleavage and polyadenylation specificity factor subunit 2 [Histoplasma ohiense]|nr:cleavage and polyadenylation specificity factor subunit 2 [Histoplasma ohiense (nom. inval.)]
MFTFTPLLGAQSSGSRAVQSILELDGGVKILVDVGWDESFDVSALAELERQIPTLSLVLLTHATPSHIGAFAHCCKTFPLFNQIPIYATSPVIALGRTLLQDLYSSAPLAATFLPKATSADSSPSSPISSRAENVADTANIDHNDSPRILLPPPTSEEIARYFSLIHPLKYSQPHQPLPSPFSPPLNGLTLTAYNAGHTVGGTIWHIQHGMESIIYAVDWNQARENVIAGAAWFGGSGASGTEVVEQLRKPTAFVCSTRGGDKFSLSGGRKKRDDLLMDMIRNCFSKGGTVLIPTDTSARALELAYVLEHAWRESAETADGEDPLKSGELYLAGKKGYGTMRLARSMLEWMDEGIVREFEAGHGGDPVAAGGKGRQDGPNQRTSSAAMTDKRGDSSFKNLGPFTFKHLKIVEHKAKLEKILGSNTPKVILTSDTSLDWGYSKHVLQKIASGSENLVILTESFSVSPNKQMVDDFRFRPSPAHEIWTIYEERKDGVSSETTVNGELLEQVHSGGRLLTVTDVEKTPLDANDLLVYQQYLATRRQLQNTAQGRGDSGLETTADALDDGSSSSSSEDSDSEQQGKVLNFSVSLAHSNKNKLGLSDADLGVNILLRRKNVHDYDVRGKKGRERMFPYVASRKRGDEYGEFIRPEEYLRAEEREEAEIQTKRGPDGRIQTMPGQKRRWGDVSANGKQPAIVPNKRQHISPGSRDLHDASGNLVIPDGIGANGTEDASASEDEVEEQHIEGPSKVTFTYSTLELNARIAFVDFSGLHDKRSLEMLIPLIQPRNLILTAGLKEETEALAAECRNLLTAKAGLELGSSSQSVVDIFTPVIGETVDASVDTNAWMVKLSSSLVKRLKWQSVRSLGVVALTGELRGPEPMIADEDGPGMSQKKQRMFSENASSSEGIEQKQLVPRKHSFPLLDVLPVNMAAATRSVTRPLHVGDLRLADLRKLMQSSGHTAEFRGEGTLLIDGFVAVRKSGTGKIEIEGAAQSALSNRSALKRDEGSFLAVKRKIYEGLAIVAGG